VSLEIDLETIIDRDWRTWRQRIGGAPGDDETPLISNSTHSHANVMR
jgi:hypothetical protein